jgi:hypothetical protein
MMTADLKNLLKCVESWPEEAQQELAAIISQIESELQGNEYPTSPDELRMIDAAMASLDAGEFATGSEVAATFAKFSKG